MEGTCNTCNWYRNKYCKYNPQTVMKEPCDTCSHWTPRQMNEVPCAPCGTGMNKKLNEVPGNSSWKPPTTRPPKKT